MSAGTQFNRWEIVLVPFPFTDLSGAKKRPALIVSSQEFNREHEDVICCLMTSKATPENNCPMLNPRDLKKGVLPFESKIKPYRLFTIQKTLIIKRIGELNSSKANEVQTELARLFR